MELVKGDDGQYFLGIKDIWSDGYHRVDRNSVVMHCGEADPYSARFIELVKAGQDDEAIKLLKSVTKMSQ